MIKINSLKVIWTKLLLFQDRVRYKLKISSKVTCLIKTNFSHQGLIRFVGLQKEGKEFIKIQ